jgi:general secretion pathway protein A
MNTPDTSGFRETTHKRLAATADPAGDATAESPFDARLFTETPNRLIHSVTTENLTNFFYAIGNWQWPSAEAVADISQFSWESRAPGPDPLIPPPDIRSRCRVTGAFLAEKNKRLTGQSCGTNVVGGWGGAMYLNFFGLTENPFNVTPDPRFLHMGAGHREILDQLRYGTRERGGLIVLTGKVGTGKTTLLQAFRRGLDEDTAVAYVFNTMLSFDGIVEYLLEDLAIAKPAESPAARLAALSNFLLERERAGQKTTLIIDEAQNLDAATLEQVSMLSNLERAPSKLLQIFLVGQPDLAAKLDHRDFRHLQTRISLRCRLLPLDADETHEYIRGRLEVAGAPDAGLFSERAIDRIAKHSGGIPRLINILGDHCLLFGYAEQRRRIDRRTVNQAIAYMEATMNSPRNRWALPRRFKWILAVVGVAVASAVAGFAIVAF